MPVATSAPRGNYVPQDYTDLFENYYTYVTRLVSKNGIDPLNAEDVAMSILSKFIENDVLADFDPTYGNREAKFSTFLGGFVSLYVRHHRERQIVRRVREPIIMDLPEAQGKSKHGMGTWGEYHSKPTVETYDDLYGDDLAQVIRKHLLTLPTGSRARKFTLVDLFDVLVEQVKNLGEHNYPAAAAALGVTPPAVRNALPALRAAVRVALEEY